MYDEHQVRWALAELESGRSISSVARDLGASVRSIKRWARGNVPRFPASVPIDPERHLAGIEADYAYLLGLYLGDGHLVEMRRQVWALRLSLDGVYTGIIESAKAAMVACRQSGTASVRSIPDSRGVLVVSYSKLWPDLFPQHGAGSKHLRDVSLHAWQSRITGQHPQDLIRGLIHSDGCRFIARQRVKNRLYRYPRYAFTNLSADILRIFTDHLDLLGVTWTRSSSKNVQIARQEAVRALDEFVGPKR